MIYQPRFEKVITRACDFLVSTQDGNLPIDPEKTIVKKGWGIFSYTELAFTQQISVANLCHVLGSNDGVTLFDKTFGNYYICYNDRNPYNRIRFTLAHEAGHIMCGHFELTDMPKFSFTQSMLFVKENSIPQIKPFWETEADVFAANFLAPAPLLEYFNLTNNEIADIFHLSYEAACYREMYAHRDANNLLQKDRLAINQLFGQSVAKNIFISNYLI